MKNALQTHSVGLVIRQKEPTNLETALDQVDSYLTPAELFYIRSHFAAPRLELASYELRIDGEVKNPNGYPWRRWKFDWLTPKQPGRYTLLARATGADGSVQPDKHDQNYGSYVINYPLPIEVFIEGPAGTSS